MRSHLISFPFMLGLILLLPWHRLRWCQRVKEANGSTLIFIQDYNAFNRSPKGLAGWINRKHAFLCRKMHSSHTGEKKRERLIDRGEETALSGGSRERGEEGRKPGNWKDGWQAKVLKRGDKTLASVLKERKGEDFTRWWTEGGREGWGLGQRKAAGTGNASHCNDDVF